MPPAPRLGSAELAAEMIEVYAMALARDVPFASAEWEAAKPIAAAVRELNATRWHDDATSDRELHLSPAAAARRRVTRFPATVVRGVGRGVADGPYLSHFLLLGNAGIGGSSGAPTERAPHVRRQPH